MARKAAANIATAHSIAYPCLHRVYSPDGASSGLYSSLPLFPWFANSDIAIRWLENRMRIRNRLPASNYTPKPNNISRVQNLKLHSFTQKVALLNANHNGVFHPPTGILSLRSRKIVRRPIENSRDGICRMVCRTIPKGLQSFSPALTRSGYAGSTSQNITNPNGVASPSRARLCNPFRVYKWIVRSPGVARSSQPQAE